LKSRLMIALLTTGVLAISAGAQDSSSVLPITAGTASLPKQLATGKSVVLEQSPGVPGPQDTPQPYLEQMQAVLQAMSGDLGQIALAIHDGKINRAQAAYLTFEQYYVGLMRLQLLRMLYQNAADGNQGEPNSQANTTPHVSGDSVVIPPPTSSPDVTQQIANYLELTPAQIAAIQAQIQEGRKAVRPLLEQLENNRRKLISTTQNGNYDSNQVEALAAEQSQILEQLIVANARLESKLYALLTNEQQQKLNDLRRQTIASVKSFPEW